MPDAADLFSGRYRVLQYVSDACVLFACAVFALLVGKHWAWGPFLVAPVLMAVGAAATVVVWHVGIAAVQPTHDQLRHAKSRRRGRNTVVVPGYVTFATGFGLIAGSIRSYWPDLVLGLMLVILVVVLPLALLRRALRRARTQHAAQPGAVE